MNSIFQSALSILLGLALSLYGLFHAVTRFPGHAAFSQLSGALPSLGAVLFFVLGLLAVAAGVWVLVVSVRRLLRRWRFLREVTARRGYVDEDEREWAGAYR